MIDFAIDNKGDLLLEKQNNVSRFRLDFHMAKYPVFVLKIFQKQPLLRVNEFDFKITFDTKRHSKSMTNKAIVIEKEEEIKQRILIQLRTELTELPARQEVGSKIQTIKHERLNDASNILSIENIVLEAIKDIVDDASVIAKPGFGEGTFYCQNVNIYIYSNNELLYKFNI